MMALFELVRLRRLRMMLVIRLGENFQPKFMPNCWMQMEFFIYHALPDMPVWPSLTEPLIS